MPNRKRIVWSAPWGNPDPRYWFQKHDSFQEAVVDLANRYAVAIVTLHAARRDSIVHEGVAYHFCGNYRGVAARVRSLRPDLVNYWGYGHPVSRMIDQACPGVPKTVYPVGSAIRFDDMPHVERFFVSTEGDRRRVLQSKCPEAAGYPPQNVVVCPFTAPSTIWPKDHDGGADRFCVLSVGGWRSLKRQELLLDALRAIDFRRAAFLGPREDPKYVAHCEPKTRSLYDRGCVELIDLVPHAAVPALMRESKVVVQPSASEGGSRVIPEALACGVPLVVCGDCRVNADQVRHNETGFVVDPTPIAIAGAVNRLLRDPNLRRTIGTRAAEAQAHQRRTAPMSCIFDREFKKLLHEA